MGAPCANFPLTLASDYACKHPVQTLGADVVGMSMVAEVTAARHCDLKVSATAVVVNLASGLTDAHITHDETIHFSNLASENLTKLLKSFLRKSDSW